MSPPTNGSYVALDLRGLGQRSFQSLPEGRLPFRRRRIAPFRRSLVRLGAKADIATALGAQTIEPRDERFRFVSIGNLSFGE